MLKLQSKLMLKLQISIIKNTICFILKDRLYHLSVRNNIAELLNSTDLFMHATVRKKQAEFVCKLKNLYLFL